MIRTPASIVAEAHLARANWLRAQAMEARQLGAIDLARAYDRMADVRMSLVKEALS
jgi:hypothetical protein